MIKAVLRLFLITVVTLILTFIAVFLVRWIGAAQSYQAPPHAWFQKDFWWIYAAPIKTLCNTKSVSTLVPNKEWIVRLPVKRVQDEWVVPCKKPQPIAEFLKNSDHADWLLDIRAGDTWGLDKLVETLQPLDEGRRFGVETHSQKAAKFLRHKAPEWVFAADSPSVLRLKLFQTMWLEMAMDFWPDFVLTSGDKKNQERLDPGNARELIRRKKRIVWDLDASADTDPEFPIHGVMTASPTEALNKFKISH